MVGIWSECKVWAIWIRMSATYIFISLLVFRTLTLHRIFVLKKPMRGWGYFLPIIIIALTSLAFNLATQFISPDLTIKYLPQLEFCKYNTNFSYGCMAFSWLVWVIYTVYLILIRNIKSSFNEFRESLVIYWIGATNIIETVIFFVLMPTYPFSQKYRILSVAFDIFTTVLPIWVLLVYPVYQRLFNRYEYLEKWQQKLTDDGLTRVYQLQEGGERYSTTNYSRMEESGRYRGSDHNQGSHGTLSNATFTNETHSTGGYAHHGQTRPGFDYNNQDYMYK
ncbi:hypothetical protein GGI12_003775 [Dipsacomyces acuminosporus]|nr:hypothetical protein GGI12_003775 [Dipsacomyces acuminosporus]